MLASLDKIRDRSCGVLIMHDPSLVRYQSRGFPPPTALTAAAAD